jgi:hypothetical protein
MNGPRYDHAFVSSGTCPTLSFVARRKRCGQLQDRKPGKTMLPGYSFDDPHICLRRAQSSGTTGEQSCRMLKKAVQQSVRRESLNVKGFGGRAPGSPTFHVSPFTFHGS